MLVNEDHHINAVYHEAGTHEMTMVELGSRFVAPVMRIFVDSSNPDDIAEVNALQDATRLESSASGPYEHPAYDEGSRKETFSALAILGRGLGETSRMFGRREETDEIRPLIATAIGWGGMPETEAFYMVESEPRKVGYYTLTLKDVPVDGF